MLMDILMESLMSMDDESLDYVLESCDTEEIEIIRDALEATAASPEANEMLKKRQNSKNKIVAKDARLERLATLIVSTRSRDNGTTKNTNKRLNKVEKEFVNTATKVAKMTKSDPRDVIEKYLRAGGINTKEALSKNPNPLVAARAASDANMAYNEEARRIKGKVNMKLFLHDAMQGEPEPTPEERIARAQELQAKVAKQNAKYNKKMAKAQAKTARATTATALTDLGILSRNPTTIW